MDRASETAVSIRNTPRTDVAQFTITARDVGTQAVRVGLMVELEEERRVLLTAARMVLGRIRAGEIQIGAAHEHMLVAAIKIAEGSDLLIAARSVA